MASEAAGNPSARRAELAGWGALAVLLCASMTLVVVLGSRLTFFNDDWLFLFQRPGLDGSSILSPHNGQLVVGIDLSVRGLVALFGYAQLPFRLFLGISVAAVGLAVYLLVAERAGRVLALAAAAILVFLGPAWENLLFFTAIGPTAALAAGLGALYLLETDSPARNWAACALLALSLSFSGVGVAFVVAAVVAVGLRRKPAELWVPALPALLYAVWVLTAGSASSDLSWANLLHVPRYMLDAASFGLASVTGLNRDSDPELRAHVALAIAAVGLVVWLIRGGRPSRQLAVFAAAAVAFWALTALSFVPGREPSASRYQLVDGALLIVIAAELFRPRGLQPWQTGLILALAAVAFARNIDGLDPGYQYLRGETAYAKAEVGALEIARGRATNDVRLSPLVVRDRFLSGITADRYFARTSQHGGISHLSPAQLSAAPPQQRGDADSVLMGAYGIRPDATGKKTGRGACRRYPAGSDPSEVTLRAGRTVLENPGGEPLAVFLGRLTPPGMPRPSGFVLPGTSAAVLIPRDSVRIPWRLTVRGRSAVSICEPALGNG